MSLGRIATSVAAGLGLVGVGYAGLAGRDDTTRTDTGQIIEGGALGALRIRIGDCFLDQVPDVGETVEVESVDAVPCSDPHTTEVYAAFNLTGDEYLGTDHVEQEASDGCYSRFEPFVGHAYETSKYDIGTFFPTELSWREVNDREVLCVVFNYDGTTNTGSAGGTKQ